MDPKEIEVLEAGEESVERATKTLSKQPRFKDNGSGGLDIADGLYSQIYTWLKHAMDEITEKPYQVNSMARDKWLREFWKLEPHWAGIVYQCVLVDSSRPWTITGGKKQVRRYAQLLHSANGGKGWRHYFRQSSLSYRVTDMGSTTELGRPGRIGPLRAIYHVDSARTKWTGKVNKPLRYYPARSGKTQLWRDYDFFNVCAMPNDDESFYGLGYCQTSRAFQLVKLLYGVLMHDQESVGAKMMRGLLLLSGIEESQWNTAMEARESQLSQMEREFFGGVFVLANSTSDVKGQLMGLSQLPASFDRDSFISQIMFGYSLISGYDPREFWPVSSGSLGTARETEQQHRKASTKGTLEFPHAWQERFQAELPETVLFEFEERDTDAEIMQAEMAQVWSDVVRTLYDAQGSSNPFQETQSGEEGGVQETQPSESTGLQSREPTGLQSSEQTGLVTRAEARSLLVSHGVIPSEWTEAEEATVISDESTQRRMIQRLMSTPEVQRSIEKWPDEEIVQYRWSPFGATERVIHSLD
jgi:hypothetical protein